MDEKTSETQETTPGPWRVGSVGSSDSYDIIDGHGNRIATVYGAVTNALLIAAAPELVDALDEVLCCHEIQPDADLEDRTELAIERASNVIETTWPE